MLRSINGSVLAGSVLATVFGIPSVMVVVTGGLRFAPILLFPCFAYLLVRWQCRLAYTIKAAREAWSTLAYLDN